MTKTPPPRPKSQSNGNKRNMLLMSESQRSDLIRHLESVKCLEANPKIFDTSSLGLILKSLKGGF